MKGYKMHKKSRAARCLTFCIAMVLFTTFLYGSYMFGKFAMTMYLWFF